MLMQVYSLVLAAVWGTLQLHNRKPVSSNTVKLEGESDWAFGQVVSLAMLLTPLIALSDQFSDIQWLVKAIVSSVLSEYIRVRYNSPGSDCH